MKQGIHPELTESQVVCASCGNAFEVRSAAGSLTLDVCSACHPIYTGKVRINSASSRVERFERRYDRRTDLAA